MRLIKYDSKRCTIPVVAYRAQIERAIEEALAGLPHGTVGIGADCLWQLTVRHIKEGPEGTNAAWVARQSYNEIIKLKPWNRFVY